MPKSPSSRIMALDYLRGFFIVVIIVDHIFRFPNVFALLSGEARLWMTAAEGFILISGLLIGYIRGFKGLKHSFSTIAHVLLKRAGILYLWMVIGSIIYLGVASWLLNIPGVPSAAVDKGDWVGLIWNILTMQHPAVWVHFLYLYAIYLFMSIGAVYLMRAGKALLVPAISLAIYIVGFSFDIEWMKWQLLFFGAATVGFYLDSIRVWWANQKKQRVLESSLFFFTLLTLISSIITVYMPSILPPALVSSLTDIFAIDSFGPARLIIAALWFTSLCLLFEKLYPLLKRYTYGVLEYFGTHSLTAYIVHGAVICLINALPPSSSSIVINTLVTFAGIMLVYGIIRIPAVKSVIPR